MYTHKKLKVWREIEEENKIINKGCLGSSVNAVLPWRTMVFTSLGLGLLWKNRSGEPVFK